VVAACPRKNGLILVCNIGGTLQPTGPSEFGRQSRSLTAAYELVQAGFKNIKVRLCVAWLNRQRSPFRYFVTHGGFPWLPACIATADFISSALNQVWPPPVHPPQVVDGGQNQWNKEERDVEVDK